MPSFYLETYGCAHNSADSERMAGILKESKYHPVKTIPEADIIIINTCTVKGPTEDAFFTRLESLSHLYPHKAIIIAGCIPQSDPEKVKKYTTIGPRQHHNITSVITSALHHNIVHLLETGETPPLNLPKIRKNSFIEIIPVNLGCLSRCTFCKTKQARGNLESYSISDITNVAKTSINEGVKEIWLTSQDTMCYGFDQMSSLPKLLKELTTLEGNFKIRIGMGNPIHFKKIKNDLIPLLNNDKIYKFIHLPIQAGSNKVLRDMRRGNTKEEWLEQINSLKSTIPQITIATDIIVGFPTETEEDFQQTLDLVQSAKPDIINIARFWPRPGTPAAKLTALPVEVVKDRTKRLSDLFHHIALEQNKKWIGWTGEILITETGKLQNQWVGRNYAYRPIIIEGNFNLGDTISIIIENATIFDLRGKALPKSITIK